LYIQTFIGSFFSELEHYWIEGRKGELFQQVLF